MFATPELMQVVERFRPILEEILKHRAPVYLVGGAVRDALLPGRPLAEDLDIALQGPVIPLAREVANRLGWAFYPLDTERGVSRLVDTKGDSRLVCDVATLRGDLESDLRERDFSVNALAIELDSDLEMRLVDPTGGLFDLEVGLLRTISVENLSADPIRMVRALRLSAQLRFEIEASTRAAISCRAEQIVACSGERIRDELWKLLRTANPYQQVEALRELNLLSHLLPELNQCLGIRQSPPHSFDVYTHSLRCAGHARELVDWIQSESGNLPDVVRGFLSPYRHKLRTHLAGWLSADRSRGDWLIWHALLHDLGKPATAKQEEGQIRFIGHEEVSARLIRERLLALRFSRAEVDLAVRIARRHMHPHHLWNSFAGDMVSERVVYRFFRKCQLVPDQGITGIDVLLLSIVDRMALGASPGRNADWIQFYTSMIDRGFAQAAELTAPLLDGKGLIERLRLEPGPIVGRILEALREAQSIGEIQDEEEALSLAKLLLAQEDRP